MRTFDGVPDALEAIMDFRADHLSELPAELQTRFKTMAASPSPVERIVGMMELLYANRDDLPNEAKELIGGLASFATVNAWHGLGDGRGSKIVQAMFRDLGEKPVPGFKAPKPETDPPVNEDYVIAKLDEKLADEPAADS